MSNWTVTVTLSRLMWISLFIQGLIHGHFVTLITATLSRFGAKSHGHFVTQSYS
jgi:hypothetical protein